jgi:hypothetical protein
MSNVSNHDGNPWEKNEYARIDRARGAEGVLTVWFENGDVVHLDPIPLVPTNMGAIDEWGIGANQYEVLIPTDHGWFEVPWDVIRLRTDPAFDAYMERQAKRTKASAAY